MAYQDQILASIQSQELIIMQTGCKRNVLRQFEAIRNLQKNLEVKSCVLILDTVTAPILSELFSLQELLQVGIKDLARIDRIKKPDPTSIGIYYISCQSLPHLYQDFSPAPLNSEEKDSQSSEPTDQHEGEIPNQSLYFSINLLLCQQASSQVLQEISQHQEVLDRIASFGELYIPCRYAGQNIGIIPFSKITEDHIESLRKVSKLGMNENLASINTTAEQEETHKKQHSEHFIHKNNFSCLPVIHFYEYEKAKTVKQLQKLQKVQKDLQEFGKKLLQSVVAGISIGLSTSIRILCFDSKFSNKIRQSFLTHLNEYLQLKMHQAHQAELSEGSAEKGTMFIEESGEFEAKEVVVWIADREIDNLTPLIRSFYYGPLLRDVFEIHDPPENKIRIISPKIQPTVLECDDKIFCQYKNEFVPEVFQKINANLQEYISSNKAAKFHKESAKSKEAEIEMKEQSAKELKNVIKQLPEYKKTIKSYHLNIQVLNCMGLMLKERNLYEETELEHLIITGCGGDRKSVKDKKILEKVFIFLEDPALTIQDKCRLMILGVCCLDIESSERNKLITRLSKVEGHGDIALGLSKISNKGIKKYGVGLGDKASKDAYMNRHQSTVSTLVQQYLSNPSSKLKSVKMEEVKPVANSSKAVLKGSLSKQKQKSVQWVVAMCGGMGYNQICDVERVFRNANQQNSRVNFVTDYIFTPNQYLQELCTLL